MADFINKVKGVNDWKSSSQINHLKLPTKQAGILKKRNN
jgi:hypothetical protein